jgi:threonine dehydrogenase-like Zn-dependent dehydrogenase
MKALVFIERKLQVKIIPLPQPSEDEVLIKVLKSGICNTDLEITKGYMNYEGVLGHEFVGYVVQSHQEKWNGKRVVGEINIPCSTCEACRDGMQKHCASRKILGISNKDGAFAEYLTLPIENLHEVPPEISDEEAVFIEPLAAAFRILEQVEIKKSDRILVLGDGKLGMLDAQVMRLESDNVACLGKHKRKLDVLRKMGVKILHKDQSREDTHQFDIVIEATGSGEGLSEAIFRVKPCGKVIMKSTFSERSLVDVSKIVVDEIKIIGSRCGPFEKAIDSLKKKQVRVKEMIDGVFLIEEADKAFAAAEDPATVKVLLDFP